jgi:hypothetical protein
MNKIFNLGNGIGAHLTYMNPVATSSEIYRLIFEIYSDPRIPNFLLKEYEVWVSETFVEDYLHLNHTPTEDEIFGFARDHLIDRYKLSGNNVPAENGVYLTNDSGEIRGDPRTFSLKTRDKRRLVRTTVMLPPAILVWLKEFKVKNKVDMGEAIRRAVVVFQSQIEAGDKRKTLPAKTR